MSSHVHTIEVEARVDVGELDGLAGVLRDVVDGASEAESALKGLSGFRLSVDVGDAVRGLEEVRDAADGVSKALKSAGGTGLKGVSGEVEGVDGSLRTAAGSAEELVKAVDGVDGKSFTGVASQVDEARSSIDSLADSMNNLHESMSGIRFTLGNRISKGTKSAKAEVESLTDAVYSLQSALDSVDGSNLGNVSRSVSSGGGKGGGTQTYRDYATGYGRRMGNVSMVTGEGFLSYVVAGSALSTIVGTGSQKEVNRITARQSGYSYEDIDKATDTSLTSMQDLIPAMYQVQAETGATGDQMNDAITPMAKFGAKIQSMGYSAEVAETAMGNLGKGLRGQFESLNDFGVTEQTLKAHGWSGEEDDFEGFMSALGDSMGETEEYMDTFTGAMTQLQKHFTSSAGAIGETVLPLLKNVIQGYNAFDDALGRWPSKLILLGSTVASSLKPVSDVIWEFRQMTKGITGIVDTFQTLSYGMKLSGGSLGSSLKAVFKGTKSSQYFAAHASEEEIAERERKRKEKESEVTHYYEPGGKSEDEVRRQVCPDKGGVKDDVKDKKDICPDTKKCKGGQGVKDDVEEVEEASEKAKKNVERDAEDMEKAIDDAVDKYDYTYSAGSMGGSSTPLSEKYTGKGFVSEVESEVKEAEKTSRKGGRSIGQSLRKYLSRSLSGIGSLFSPLTTSLGSVVSAVTASFSGVTSQARELYDSVAGFTTTFFSTIGGSIKGFGSKIGSVFSGLTGSLGTARGAFKSMTSTVTGKLASTGEGLLSSLGFAGTSLLGTGGARTVKTETDAVEGALKGLNTATKGTYINGRTVTHVFGEEAEALTGLTAVEKSAASQSKGLSKTFSRMGGKMSGVLGSLSLGMPTVALGLAGVAVAAIAATSALHGMGYTWSDVWNMMKSGDVSELTESINAGIDGFVERMRSRDWTGTFSNLFSSIGQLIGDINWGDLAKGLGNAVLGVGKGLADALSDTDFSQVGASVVDGIWNLIETTDWKGVAIDIGEITATLVISGIEFGIGMEESIAKHLTGNDFLTVGDINPFSSSDQQLPSYSEMRKLQNNPESYKDMESVIPNLANTNKGVEDNSTALKDNTTAVKNSTAQATTNETGVAKDTNVSTNSTALDNNTTALKNNTNETVQATQNTTKTDTSEGGGFWSGLWNSIKGLFGGGNKTMGVTGTVNSGVGTDIMGSTLADDQLAEEQVKTLQSKQSRDDSYASAMDNNTITTTPAEATATDEAGMGEGGVGFDASQVTAMTEALTSMNAELTTANTGLTTFNETFTTLGASLTTMNDSITTLTTGLTTMNESFTTLNTGLTLFNDTLTTLNPSLTTFSTTLTELNPNLTIFNDTFTLLNTAFTTFSTTLATVNADFTTFSTTLTTVNTSLTTFNETLTLLAPAITTFSTNLAMLNPNLLMFSQDLASALPNLLLFSTTMTLVGVSTSLFSANMASISASMSNLSATLSDVISKLNTFKETMSTIGTDMISAFRDGFSGLSDVIAEEMDGAKDTLEAKGDELIAIARRIGQEMGAALRAGMEVGSPGIIWNTVRDEMEGTVNELQSSVSPLTSAGYDAGEGVADGFVRGNTGSNPLTIGTNSIGVPMVDLPDKRVVNTTSRSDSEGKSSGEPTIVHNWNITGEFDSEKRVDELVGKVTHALTFENNRAGRNTGTVYMG